MKCEFCGKEKPLNEWYVIDNLEITCPELVDVFMEDASKIEVFKNFLKEHVWMYSTNDEEQDSYVIKLNNNELIKQHRGNCIDNKKTMLLKDIIDLPFKYLTDTTYEEKKRFSYNTEYIFTLGDD
jgi:hypothetical protein